MTMNERKRYRLFRGFRGLWLSRDFRRLWTSLTITAFGAQVTNLALPLTAALLLKALRARHPGLRLLLTHGTATGRAEGVGLLRPGDVQVWQPWDAPAASASDGIAVRLSGGGPSLVAAGAPAASIATRAAPTSASCSARAACVAVRSSHATSSSASRSSGRSRRRARASGGSSSNTSGAAAN